MTCPSWVEYTEELYKKDLHNPDNHDGMITDLEPDILQCEVKWALESITTNKASGGDGIPVKLFQSLVQGKEQRLRFAGAAVKRYPTSKLRETQVRWYLKKSLL